MAMLQFYYEWKFDRIYETSCASISCTDVLVLHCLHLNKTIFLVEQEGNHYKNKYYKECVIIAVNEKGLFYAGVNRTMRL